MKRFKTEYSESSITYWPTYEAGIIGIIFFVVLETAYVVTAICILLDNTSRGPRLATLFTLPISVCVLYVVLCYIYRTMHMKITVSAAEITYMKNNVAEEEKIEWSDVETVCFYQDPWHGRKSCRIFLNEESSKKCDKKDACDFVLPVASVDEQKLLQLIPNHLWKNNPWWC